MNPFRILSVVIGYTYAVARVAFAVVELVLDTADWCVGMAEQKWEAWKWSALNWLARTAYTGREMELPK